MNKQFYSLFILLNLFIWSSDNQALTKERKINISLFKKQAERGNVKTQNTLGDYYNSITTMPVDEGCSPYNRKQTIKYYTKAARQGYDKAQKSLGMLYTQIPCPDYDKGIFWYKKAAKLNNTMAMVALGKLYEEYDYDKAIYWYKKASNLGNSYGSLALCDLYFIAQNTSEEFKKYYKKKEYLKILKNQINIALLLPIKEMQKLNLVLVRNI